MTGNELRRKVADIINAWDGATRGSAKHLEILNIYNNHKPLARGYRVQVGDAHCATTTSAAYIKAGIAEYTGTECGVEEFTPGYMHAYKIGGKRYNSFFTAYSRRKTTSAPVTMAQLVFPLLPEDDPARTARAARFDAAADGTVKVEFETPGSGRKVQATITGRGAEVKRR